MIPRSCKIFFLLLFVSFCTQAQIITTYAGIGGVASYTGDGGPATDATMYSPYGLALDDAGNLYVAERINNVIRKIAPSGIISTFAGNGTAGYSGDGGQATNAEINTPYCITIDHNGILYFTDNANNVIRKVNTAGIISTVRIIAYGDCAPGALPNYIQNPTGIAIDASGHIIFANTDWRVIMKVMDNDTAINIAGNCALSYTGDGGLATNAALNHPFGIALDHAGNLYIADDGNNVVRKVDPTGIISTYAGNGYAGAFYGDGGPATAAGIYGPVGVTTDSAGNLYIQDLFNHRIRKVSTSGIMTTIAGNGIAAYAGDGGLAVDASFDDATGFAIYRNGDFYISDLSYSVIRKVTMGSLASLGVGNINTTVAPKVSLFPNPNNGAFILVSPQGTQENMHLNITNVLGQVVYIESIPATQGMLYKEIKLTGQPNGIYLVHLSGANKNEVIKCVVE